MEVASMVGWGGAAHGSPRRLRVAVVLSMALWLASCRPSGPRIRQAEPVVPTVPEKATGAPQPGAAAVAPPPAPSSPRGSTRLITNVEGPLEVPTGQSLLLRLSTPAERVSIADPDVAEVVVVSPQQVLVNGKGRKVTRTTSSLLTGQTSSEEVLHEAQTSVIVWDREGRYDVRTLYVNRARPEQILLEVTVADLNRTMLEEYGVDFQVLQGDVLVAGNVSKLFSPLNGQVLGNIVPGMANSSTTPDLAVPPDRLTYFVQDLNNNFLGFVELLQRENMAKILARPSLMARSGEEAHFRVGGEVPIVYATQNISQVTFKEFGALLAVTPALTDDGQIDLRIATEVSEPNFARTVSIGGNVLPTFISRRAETRVRLREGESLVIGGLYREDESEAEDKVPYLGDIPYLGAFFRRTRFERTRNELLILVKPRVVRTAAEVTPTRLPTDRPPLSREEVRTKSDPHEVSRPRLLPGRKAEEGGPETETAPPEGGE
jgi:pilus assembly protein CpaC